MRYLTPVLSVLTIVLLGCAGWQFLQSRMEPAVVVTGGEVFDAGKVASGKSVTHVFKVENKNSFSVGLAAPVAGCTCTTATVSSSVIPAHGFADVTLHVEPEDGAITGSASVTTWHGSKSVETVLFVTGESPARSKTTPNQ